MKKCTQKQAAARALARRRLLARAKRIRDARRKSALHRKRLLTAQRLTARKHDNIKLNTGYERRHMVGWVPHKKQTTEPKYSTNSYKTEES